MREQVDLVRVRYLARGCPGFLPTRDQWEEIQKAMFAMANEIEQARKIISSENGPITDGNNAEA